MVAEGTMTSNPSKITVKHVEMSEDMANQAQHIALEAFEKSSVEKDIATYIKKQFDAKYGAIWHCVVGKSFGSYVTHETNNFIYFYLGTSAVLLFKSG